MWVCVRVSTVLAAVICRAAYLAAAGNVEKSRRPSVDVVFIGDGPVKSRESTCVDGTSQRREFVSASLSRVCSIVLTRSRFSDFDLV